MADDGITVTLDQMWDLLQRIDRSVLQAVAAHDQYTRDLVDHEERLRALEGHADLTYRVGELESATRDQQQQLEDLKRRVWAIPTVATAAAVVAMALGVSAFLTR